MNFSTNTLNISLFKMFYRISGKFQLFQTSKFISGGVSENGDVFDGISGQIKWNKLPQFHHPRVDPLQVDPGDDQRLEGGGEVGGDGVIFLFGHNQLCFWLRYLSCRGWNVKSKFQRYSYTPFYDNL